MTISVCFADLFDQPMIIEQYLSFPTLHHCFGNEGKTLFNDHSYGEEVKLIQKNGSRRGGNFNGNIAYFFIFRISDV
jgi:hypothetical protein